MADTKQVAINKETHRLLKIEAARLETSVSGVIKMLLKLYLKDE